MTPRLVFATLTAVSLFIFSLCALDYARMPIRAVIAPATDRIIVEKSAHRMTLLKDGHVIRTYQVAIGRGGLGEKQESGDHKVPEGLYQITGRNPESAYHLSLRIGYPTALQARTAQRGGINPGGDIMIHGIRNGLGWVGKQHRLLDWTQGCVAVTNAEIEEIWRLVPDLTSIEIRS